MHTLYEAAKRLLPELGRIEHLPHKPNTDRGDLVATEEHASVIFEPGVTAVVEDKIASSMFRSTARRR